MMNRTKKKLMVVGCGLLIALVATLFLVPIPGLVVQEQKQSASPAIVVPFLAGEKFSLNYVHSVQKTPVQENFVLAPKNCFLLTSTTYRSLGVGLPFLAQEGKLENKNGLFILTGLHRSFKEINEGFMPLAKQALQYNNKIYPFKDYFSAGALIKIVPVNYSAAKFLWLSMRT